MLLKFGIPSLDELIEVPNWLEVRPPDSAAESLAILGPEGSGKSLLALHLASRYTAECKRLAAANEARPLPRILYVSSDLKAESAKKMWENFGLDEPNLRQIPFERNQDGISRFKPAFRDLLLTLNPVWAGSEKTGELVRELLLNDPPHQPSVSFLDLASHTAGDDWSLVNALLVKLQAVDAAPANGKGNSLPHLVIIDSVAGFETFVGRIDAYGNEQSRRSRIAQCLRNAGSRISLVFVVEEARASEHLPEEFVTDVVLSLSKRNISQNAILTVEVQKARAREHAKGEHPFEIRGNKGTSTGDWENADNPRTRNAYVQVFPSISHRNNLISSEYTRTAVHQDQGSADFGIKYLDEMLHGTKPGNRGLTAGTVTALIGHPSTGKSSLAEKFLAQGFITIAKQFIFLSACKKDIAMLQKDDLKNVISAVAESLAQDMISLDDCSRPILGDIKDWGQLVEALEKANNEGRDLTTAKLKEMNPEDSVDWTVRVEASKLANVNIVLGRKGRESIESTKVTPPNTRAGWDLDWEKIRKDNIGELFRHPNLRSPGLLLTTRDRRGKEAADACLRHLEDSTNDFIEQLGSAFADDTGWRTETLRQLTNVIDSQLVVRRFDLQASPASAVFHLIHRNLTETHKLIFGLAYPRERDVRYSKARRIRAVIDDLRVLTDINPDLKQETAFLPFLMFLLAREGVVSLLVHTDSLRPNISPEDETSKVLLSILKRAILTWDVPLEGRRRIAISSIPHNQDDNLGIVRELKLKANDAYFMSTDVTRHLELYSGIEEAKPLPVPLAVYLFSETEQFETYLKQEDTLFRELFTSVERRSPVRPGRILFPFDAERFLSLRDRTNLTLDMQDAHTLVLQIDEHWALKPPNALEDLNEYWEASLRKSGGKSMEDPFGVFSGKPPADKSNNEQLRGEKPAEECQRTATAEKKAGPARKHFFRNCHYQGPPLDSSGEEKRCRVPFMWDFGFILARKAPWEILKEEHLKGHLLPPVPWDTENALVVDWMRFAVPFCELEKEATGGPDGEVPADENEPISSGGVTRIKDVFNRLSGIGEPIGTGRSGNSNEAEAAVNPKTVSWRKFFGACTDVAAAHRQQTDAMTMPFEVASPSSETINALLLEIWFSELYLEAKILGIDLTEFGFSKVDEGSSVGTSATAGAASGIVPGLKPGGEFRIDTVLRYIKPLTNGMKGQQEAKNSETIAEAFRTLQSKLKEQIGKKPDSQSCPDLNSSSMSSEPKDGIAMAAGLPFGAFCLYKAWLLLSEVFDFEKFLDSKDVFVLRQGGATSVHAVASRHWYKTASTFSRELYASAGIHDSLVPMRLPGSYSTRGDWFLGYTKSSRSKLLAEHAIDLLSSRRANITRMQHGLGLPVRDFIEGPQCGEFRTALLCSGGRKSADGRQSGSPIDLVTYGALCKLGRPSPAPGQGGSDFEWLFRSHIKDFDRLSRPLQKWLGRLFRWSSSQKKWGRRPLKGGFAAYDEFTCKRFSFSGYEELEEFAEMCDFLCAALSAAERK